MNGDDNRAVRVEILKPLFMACKVLELDPPPDCGVVTVANTYKSRGKEGQH